MLPEIRANNMLRRTRAPIYLFKTILPLDDLFSIENCPIAADIYTRPIIDLLSLLSPLRPGEATHQ
jgi:hypothetical protein|uniref:Uncharacterized protein n=1 Tax=Picea glauca TaxID=3330 RepID=A0A101LZK0_PICGL|nr:hypothetical protein ABT39_MTgene5148 [Picea glauca]